MRQRGFGSRDSILVPRTGPLAFLKTTFVLKIFQVIIFILAPTQYPVSGTVQYLATVETVVHMRKSRRHWSDKVIWGNQDGNKTPYLFPNFVATWHSMIEATPFLSVSKNWKGRPEIWPSEPPDYKSPTTQRASAISTGQASCESW